MAQEMDKFDPKPTFLNGVNMHKKSFIMQNFQS